MRDPDAKTIVNTGLAEEMRAAREKAKAEIDPIKRIRKLQKAERDRDLTDEEEMEYHSLHVARTREILFSVPVPKCCEESRKRPIISWHVDVIDSKDTHKSKGQWYLRTGGYDELEAAYTVDYPFERRPPPQFCPFCGTGLPKMRRKKVLPKNLCRITDGGNYCDTCRQRLDSCLCDPIASAFEEVK